jgi:hypothetical protein
MGRALIFGDEVNAEEYVAVTVVNRGDLATTITNMTVHQYRSIFHRWYRKAFWSAIVKEPGAITGREPPYVLSPGTQWMGIVPYNGDLLERVKLGNLFVAIHATHVGRSVAKRVIWKPDSRDNLPQSED